MYKCFLSYKLTKQFKVNALFTKDIYLYRWFYRELVGELTPLVADQHRTSCMSGAVVSLAAGKQIVPEHCRALKHTNNTQHRLEVSQKD